MSGIIDGLRRQARVSPRAIALAGNSDRLSFAELVVRVAAAARALAAVDARVVGIMADNCIDWVVADLATLHDGITSVPVPPYFTARQVAHLIDSAGIDTLVVDARSARVAAIGFAATGCRIGGLQAWQRRETSARVSDAPAKITFTSGSTGTPRGVCLDAATIDGCADRLCGIFRDLRIERHLCSMPLATLLENVAGVYVPLLLGAAVHVPSLAGLGLYGSSRIDAARFLRTIDDCRAQSLILQPQVLRELTAAARRTASRTSSLRFVAVGGARVTDADLDDAVAAGIPAYQGYGLSECASVVALNRPGDRRSGSVGRPLPGLEIRIAADGEILVRNQAMRGYLGEPAAAGVFVATGDLGRIDEDGYLYVCGRKKDVFITSYGRNVSPEWPEAELLHEPAIAQACVFGEARPTNTAVVVAAADDTGVELAIRNANRRLPDYARVSDWIIASEPFSVSNGLLTATGKPRRDAVALRYLAGDGTAPHIDARQAARAALTTP